MMILTEVKWIWIINKNVDILNEIVEFYRCKEQIIMTGSKRNTIFKKGGERASIFQNSDLEWKKKFVLQNFLEVDFVFHMHGATISERRFGKKN